MNYLHAVFIIALLSLGVVLPSQAGIAIIVNPKNTNAIDINDVRKIFLGKTKVFPNGQEATPLDLLDTSAEKEEFSNEVLRKSTASLNSYWSRMLFSSKGKPPRSLDSDQVKQAVAENKDAIGYINSSDVDSSVKVLFSVP